MQLYNCVIYFDLPVDKRKVELVFVGGVVVWNKSVSGVERSLYDESILQAVPAEPA